MFPEIENGPEPPPSGLGLLPYQRLIKCLTHFEHQREDRSFRRVINVSTGAIDPLLRMRKTSLDQLCCWQSKTRRTEERTKPVCPTERPQINAHCPRRTECLISFSQDLNSLVHYFLRGRTSLRCPARLVHVFMKSW